MRYLSASAETKLALETQPEADVLFNYMGQWEKNLSPDSRFRFARPIQAFQGTEGSRSHILKINAMVFDGQLQVAWTFSHELYAAGLVEDLAAQFRQNLRDLINYCVTTEDSTLTPSDFPTADLSQEDLDDLLAEFGE